MPLLIAGPGASYKASTGGVESVRSKLPGHSVSEFISRRGGGASGLGKDLSATFRGHVPPGWGGCVNRAVDMIGAGSSAGGHGDDPIDLAWESIRAGLRRDCGARTFDNWLKPAQLAALDDDGTIRIALPSAFMATWVETHYAERLLHAWRLHLPHVRRVLVSTGIETARPALFTAEPAAPVIEEVAEERDRRRRGAPARIALHVRQLRRRQGQRGRLQRRADAGRGRRRHLQPAVPPRRHRARQDSPDARDRPRISAPARAEGEDRLHVGREVHVRVRRCAPRPRHAQFQAAAALGRSC